MNTWPDIYNGIICGDCYALIKITTYQTCRKYCESIGLECRYAFEEIENDCNIKSIHDCDTNFRFTSDALCQCSHRKDGKLSL